jgi:hypothetical protein
MYLETRFANGLEYGVLTRLAALRSTFKKVASVPSTQAEDVHQFTKRHQNVLRY